MASYLNKYSPFLQLVVFIGIYLGCTLIYSFVFMGWLLPHWFGISAADLQSGNLNDPNLLEVMKVFQVFYSVFSFLIPALLFFYLLHPRPLRYVGLRSKFYPGWALAGIVILIISLPAVGMLADWNQHIHFGPLDQPVREMQQKAQDITKAMLKMPHWGSLFFNLIIIAIVPAIAEEFFFRGVLQRLFIAASRKAWIGIGIAAIVFSLLHGEMLGFFPRAALGIVLGAIYYFSGNLWYSVIAHFFNNAFQIVLVYLYQQGLITQDITRDSPTPLAYGIFSVILVVIMFIIFQKFIPEHSQRDYFLNLDEADNTKNEYE